MKSRKDREIKKDKEIEKSIGTERAKRTEKVKGTEKVKKTEKVKRIMEDERWKPYVQFVKFGLVGVSNTVVFYLLYAGILFLLRGVAWKQDYVLANVIAFTVSIFWSFYWNNKYVFRQAEEGRRDRRKALGKCFLSYGFTGYILENVLSCIWVEGFGISKYVSPLLNLVFTVPTNFLLNKLWAFRDKR